MPESHVKKVCPTCRSYGLLQLPAARSGAALICPHCDGKGWIALHFDEFTERKLLPGITTVTVNNGQARHMGARRLPTVLTLGEYLLLFPV